MSKLRVFWDFDGQVSAVYLNRGSHEHPVWASLPYENKTFLPKNAIESALLLEAQSLSEWPLDLSNRSPEAPLSTNPNWDSFFVQAYLSPVYLRIAEQNQLLKQRAVTRLENLLGNKPYYQAQYELLKRFWDDAVNGIVPALSTSEIAALNAIATNNFMPFKFEASGKMDLLLST